MKLTKTDITELHQRATWAASKGYTIARADEYLAALCKQNGMKFFGESATADAISQLTGALLAQEIQAEPAIVEAEPAPKEDLEQYMSSFAEPTAKVEEVAEPDMSGELDPTELSPLGMHFASKSEPEGDPEPYMQGSADDPGAEEAPPAEEKAPAKPAKSGNKPSKKG